MKATQVPLPRKSEKAKKSKSLKLGHLKPTKKDLQMVTEHAPDIICRFDKTCRLLYVNPAIERTTGISVRKFINKTTRELGMPDEHSKNWEEGVSRVFSSGKQTTLEFPFLTPTGLRHFHCLLVPEHDGEGVIETVLSISRDITEMKEKDQRKEEVVGFVSHELKNPVTSLKAFAQILRRKFTKAGDMNTAEHFEKMNMQIDKLTNIISDLMEATRIESGTMKIQKEEFDFNSLVKETVNDVRRTTKTHKIKIKGKAKKNIAADRFRIGQVLTNLLCNSIKYSPKASQITVKIYSDKKKLMCSVEDKGIGISKEKQEKIFERFYRVSDPRGFNVGLGLGLYISSEIIKKHDGKIWVKSREGKGSTFYFTLPLK